MRGNMLSCGLPVMGNQYVKVEAPEHGSHGDAASRTCDSRLVPEPWARPQHLLLLPLRAAWSGAAVLWRPSLRSSRGLRPSGDKVLLLLRLSLLFTAVSVMQHWIVCKRELWEGKLLQFQVKAVLLCCLLQHVLLFAEGRLHRQCSSQLVGALGVLIYAKLPREIWCWNTYRTSVVD